MRLLLVFIGILFGSFKEIYCKSQYGYQGKRYDGYQLLRVYPKFFEDLQLLTSLKNDNTLKADFWHSPERSSNHIDVLIDPRHKGRFHAVLQGQSIRYVVSHPSFQKIIDRQFDKSKETEKDVINTSNGFNLNKYLNFDQIVSWMLLQEETHKKHLSVIQIGNTVEGRPIYTVKISYNGKQRHAKPGIWLDAGIHSNEWVAPATMLHFIDKLVNGYDIDPSLTVLLDTYDWFITPVLNVDGYSYSWAKDRLWRKNRRKHVGSDCVGVDLNRNWESHWGEGSSAAFDPCDRMFVGPSAMSEPEVRAVSDYIKQQNGTIVAYLAFHNYGQMWMTPFSYSKNAVFPEQDLLLNMSREAVAALETVYGTKYRVGRISELVGETSGASVDYMYENIGIKYSFGIELRDEGWYGTLLPPVEIQPTAEEAFVAVKKLATLMYDKVK